MENITKIGLAGVVLAVGCVIAKGDAQQATIEIVGNRIVATVADTYTQRQIGLARYSSTDDIGADGMLFTFDTAADRTFWMHGMAFPIDIVWIHEGRVVRLDEGVPPPSDGEAPASISSAPLLVDMVLELPAGDAKRLGIVTGTSLRLSLDGTAVTW